MTLSLRNLLLTEVSDLDITKILSMRDRHLLDPAPEQVRTFLIPREPGKEFIIYEAGRGGGCDYFVGNGNKRALALELAGISLPHYIGVRQADEEMQDILERNAQAFYRAFGVRTAPEFVETHLAGERVRHVSAK